MLKHLFTTHGRSIGWLMVRLIIGIVLPLAFIGWIGISYGRDGLHDIATQNAEAITTLKSNMMTSWIDDRKAEIDGLARSEAILEPLDTLFTEGITDTKRTDALLLLYKHLNEQSVHEHPSIRSLTIIDNAGNVLAHTPLTANIDITDPEGIVASAKEHITLASRFDPEESRRELYIAAPIVRGNAAHGFIFAELDTDTFVDIVSDRSGLGNGGASYMFDDHGEIIAPRATEETITLILPSPTFIAKILTEHKETGLKGIFTTSDERPGETVVSYTTLPTGWILVTEIRQDEFLGVINWPLIIAILGLLIFLAVLLTIVNLRALVDPQQNAVDQLTQAGTSLSATSQQVVQSAQSTAAIAEQVAQGAATQSAQAENISHTVSEMATGAQEMFASAEEAARVARDVSQVTQVAGEKGEQSQVNLEQIRKMTTDTAMIARTMGSRSREIRVIVDTITKIAEQTNLLSLNAAIEAARAGDAGRGFSVVADEIRKLAEQSAGAADEIKGQVEQMLLQINDTVLAAEKGLEHADENARVVGQALSELANISSAIQQLSARIKEISTRTEKQTGLVQHVAESMDAIARVAEQNTVGAEQLSASTQQQSAANQQVAAAAQQLQALALDLKRLTGGATTSLEHAQSRLDEHTTHRKPIPAYVLEKKTGD